MPESLYIGGTLIDRVASNITLIHCTPWGKDTIPSLTFAQRGVALAALPDPYLNKTISYTLPSGTLLFVGDVQKRLTHNQPGIGWTYEYECTGIKQRGSYIPVTDSNTQTDTARFNLSPDDPYRLLSRTGRTGGQIIIDVLEMVQNKTALMAAGLGNYSSAGSGASATAVMTGMAVSSFANLVGGTGYTSPPTVVLAGGGGSGATAAATVSGGVVTAINVVTGGAGYTTSPIVILSTLPAATINDLLALDYVLPFETDVAGERILQALEGTAQISDPNVWLHVELDGTIRFLDPFGFTPTTLTLGNTGSGDPRVGFPEFTRDISGCYSRVLLRGQTFVNSLLVGLLPLPGSSKPDGGLQKDYAHDGLTITQSETDWIISDWQQPGQPSGEAIGVAALSGSAVGSISVQYGGYGYLSAPPVTITGGGGTGATATSTITSGVVTGFTVTAGGSGFTGTPFVLVGPPANAGSFDQGTCTLSSTTNITITSSNPYAKWPAGFWDQTDSGKHATLLLWSDTTTGVEQQWGARVVSNPSMSPGGTCVLTIDNPAPSLNYTAYQLTGTSGGANAVGRRYKLTDTTQGSQLMPFFPYPQPLRNSDGTAATLTSTPTAILSISSLGNGQPPYTQSPCGLSIDPESGTILLNKPAQLAYSPDNRTPVWPDNVQAFLAVADGVLSVVYPPDAYGSPVYGGTSYTVEGLERTKTVSANDWKDPGATANQLLFAQKIWQSVSNTVIEGSLPYYGLLESVLTPGLSINIAADTYVTGWESVDVPIVSVDLTFNEGGGSGTSYDMEIHVSNRRAPYSGEVFRRPSQTGMGALNAFEGTLALSGPQMLENVNATNESMQKNIASTTGQAAEFARNQSAMDPGIGAIQSGAASFQQANLEASASAAQNAPTSMAQLGIDTDTGAVARSASQGLAENAADAAAGLGAMASDATGGLGSMGVDLQTNAASGAAAPMTQDEKIERAQDRGAARDENRQAGVQDASPEARIERAHQRNAEAEAARLARQSRKNEADE